MAEFNFFGQNMYRGQTSLLICEGEQDAMAADIMLNGSSNRIGLNTLCVSVPTGANINSFKVNKDFINKFKRVTYCPDMDEAGEEVVQKIAELSPDILFMRISEKDANDMLIGDKKTEFSQAYGLARRYRPPAVEVLTDDDIESLLVPLKYGLSYPWDSATRLTYGMVPHSIVSVGSGPGAGKTSVIRGTQQHLMFEHKVPIGIFSLEEHKTETLRYLTGYMMNQRIHIPGAAYDVNEAVLQAKSLRDKAFFFNSDHYNGEWSELEGAFRSMYYEGVRHFFVDPVSALVAHLSASDGNTYLNSMMIKLKNLKNELPIWIMLVNHLNNPTNGPSHDEGGRVLPSQFTGSKGQWKYSTEMVGFERNILSEDEDEKHTLIWRQLKHRADGSKTGRIINLHYNKDTGRLDEPSSNFTPVAGPTIVPKPDPSPKMGTPTVNPPPPSNSVDLNDLLGGKT